MSLPDLVTALRASPGWAAKRDLQMVAQTSRTRSSPATSSPANGDDCAAFPDGLGGYLLLAAEAMWPELVRTEPFFAGYCSVMVNVSDVAAMGGRPLGLVDTLWSAGPERAGPLWAGLQEGARRYAVPLVGGHTNLRSPYDALGVAILGRARHLLTSFDARPGERLVAAVDLRGAMHPVHAFWNASEAHTERLRGDLEVLPLLAEEGLSKAGKDISMAGVLGSLLMLLECSGVGAEIDLAALPRPRGDVELLHWLQAFPSFGFVLSAPAAHAERICRAFAARDVAAAVVGEVDDTREVTVRDDVGTRAPLWSFRQEPFMGFAGREQDTPS